MNSINLIGRITSGIKNPAWFYFALLALFVSSCSTSQKVVEMPTRFQFECDLLDQNYSSHAPDTLDWSRVDSSLIENYSKQMLGVVQILGLSKEFIELEKLRKIRINDNSQSNIIALELAEDDFVTAVAKQSTEMDEFEARLNCKLEKTNDVKEFLAAENSKVERKLTISAIIVGGATAVIAGVMALGEDRDRWEVGTTNDYIGAIGGVITVYLSIKAIQVDLEVEYPHKNNVMQAIFSDSATTLVPVGFTNFLNEDIFFTDWGNWHELVHISYQELLESRFKKEKERNRVNALILSDGGMYTYDSMELREQLFEDISSAVNLYQVYLKRLLVVVKNGGNVDE